MIQKDKHDEGSGTPIEDESGPRTSSEKVVHSEDTDVNSLSEGEKQSETQDDPEKDQSNEKD